MKDRCGVLRPASGSIAPRRSVSGAPGAPPWRQSPARRPHRAHASIRIRAALVRQIAEWRSEPRISKVAAPLGIRSEEAGRATGFRLPGVSSPAFSPASSRASPRTPTRRTPPWSTAPRPASSGWRTRRGSPPSSKGAASLEGGGEDHGQGVGGRRESRERRSEGFRVGDRSALRSRRRLDAPNRSVRGRPGRTQFTCDDDDDIDPDELQAFSLGAEYRF